MLSHLQWLLLKITRKVWVRATAFSVLGIVTALIALVVKRYIPADIPTKIGSDAVDSLLNIIATSMLTVTIFSLSTMVAAFASATSNVTPRATRLLVEDSTSQNALATFVGSFLFSLVGIIVLRTGLYGETGRVVLYVVTLFVIALVVVTLLRWIDYVLRLGRVQPTTERVEQAATKAMVRRRDGPYLGGVCRSDDDDHGDIPQGAVPLHAHRLGYVQFIDMRALQDIGDSANLQIYIDALPGQMVDTVMPLCFVLGHADEPTLEKVREAHSVGDTRSFDQDPRFGLCVLSEIASRALSPALNDPGTAIDVITRGARVLATWSKPPQKADETRGNSDSGDDVRFPRIHVPPILLDELFDDFFMPIARDGAGLVEVDIHLHKALQALANMGDTRFVNAAIRHSRLALTRSEMVLTMPDDIARVRRAAGKVSRQSSASAQA